MCHVYYYNNSDATFRLLMSGDTNPNPVPVSASTAGKINCLVMNARSLKSYHKDSTTNWQSVRNLHRFQGLVYAETLTLYICVNETWLNQNISVSEMLHSGISGDFNLPDILWDSTDSSLGVNELIETLHDHLLTQLNKKRTCGNNILDLVITSLPNRVNVTDTDCFQKIRFFLQTTCTVKSGYFFPRSVK